MRKEIYIKIADKVFRIVFSHPFLYNTTKIQFEKMIVFPSKGTKIITITEQDVLNNKFFNLYAYFVKIMADNYLFFHASGVEKNCKAKIFVGPQNHGKTTAFLYSILKGYNALGNEMIIISLSDHMVYSFPCPLKIFDDEIIKYFEKISHRQIRITYSEKAHLEEAWLLTDVNTESPPAFLFKNCFNRFYDRRKTFCNILNLLEKIKFNITFKFDIFKEKNKTIDILQKIL
ncbi:MAG: hypothetical protein AB7E08_01225 [Candidatus Omnitrophota bacterium]